MVDGVLHFLELSLSVFPFCFLMDGKYIDIHSVGIHSVALICTYEK